MINHEKNENIINLQENIQKITSNIDIRLAGSHDHPAIIRYQSCYYQLDKYLSGSDQQDNNSENYFIKELAQSAVDNSSASSLYDILINPHKNTIRGYITQDYAGIDEDGNPSNYSYIEDNTTPQYAIVNLAMNILHSEDSVELNNVDAEKVMRRERKILKELLGERDSRKLRRWVGMTAVKSSFFTRIIGKNK